MTTAAMLGAFRLPGNGGHDGAVRQVWNSYGHVIVATVVLLPVAAGVAWLRCRRLRGRLALRHAVAEVGMVVGTLPWLWMTFTPTAHGRGGWQLVPLRDLAVLVTGPVETLVVQLVGNLLVFAALGFWLPVRWSTFTRLTLVVAVAAAGAVGIELTQALLDLGRVSSVDDVVLNATGAGLAALASRRWWSGGTAVAVAAATDALPGGAAE